jgi:hypothetical protein
MSINHKPLATVAEADLQMLKDNEVSEVKTLEYKAELPGNSVGDRKEFLADVSSFANAAGGDIIYGMKEAAGVPTELSGVVTSDVDREILRLESSIRDGIEPRIPGLSTHAVRLGAGTHMIIIRIPRSWALPHMVKLGGSSRFYSRDSRGKYQLDVAQIRAAFALSETTSERIRNFRIERLAQIVANNGTPMILNEPPFYVLHIVPVNAFDPAVRYDTSSMGHLVKYLMPMGGQGIFYRHNFDGYLTYSHDGEAAYAYLQVFRNGIIESVRATYEHSAATGRRLIPSAKYEEEVLDALSRFLELQKQLGVEPPLLVMLSLMGVKGYSLTSEISLLGDKVIDRDALIVPEVMIDDFGSDPDDVMKDSFNAVWNAAGHERCRNYDAMGKRMKRPFR